MITLQPISEDNFEDVLELEAPEELVAPNSFGLAEAYLCLKAINDSELHQKHILMPFAIVNDETVVGFLMIGFEDGKDVFSDGDIYWLARFMIDEKYQGKGYGKAALTQLIDFVKTGPNGNEAKYFYTSVVPHSPVAAKMYENAGFEKTGQIYHGEEVMRLVF